MRQRLRTRRIRPTVLDPIITMNSGGVIQSASDSVEQVFGWTPTELLGRNVKVLIPEPRRSALDRYLDRYRHSDKSSSLQRTSRFEAMRKDGSRLAIELSMSRADIPALANPYFIGIVRDVSHQIDVGASATGVRLRLQQLVTEQTRALASAHLRLQLADRLASLGTLAAGLGHDMNNVLLPVRARLNALEHATSSPAALAHLRAVRRSVAYLQQLSDALHYLVVDPGSGSDEHDGTGVTELASWWSRMGPLLRKALPRSISFQSSIPHGLPAVGIASHWLTQAVLNLLVNAGEATAAGTRRPQVRVRAGVSDDGRHVRLSVADNGRGMTQQVQRKAFDLFFTTKSRSIGTGLGLPLVRKVAVGAGGDVELRSSPGRGCTVTLVLPIAVQHTAPDGRSEGADGSAKVSVRDHRASALLTQILIGSGIHVSSQRGAGPGRSRVWVTRPTAAALAFTGRWRKGHAERTVVLLGPPRASMAKRWSVLEPVVIDPPEDFLAMRSAVHQAVERAWQPPAPRGKR